MSLESVSPATDLHRRAGPYTFAALFSIESFARAINSTVVSLQAYDILGASQKVSMLSTSVSIFMLANSTLVLPIVLGKMRRRSAYTLAAALMALASLAFGTHSLAGQWSGMLLRLSGAAVFNISLQLYILDHIRRQDLTRTEPLRLSLSTFSWMAGPALGVWLYVRFGPWGPQLLVVADLILLMAVFWTIRLSERTQPQPRASLAPPPGPLANVERFIAQPRLRLAWTIAFGRSCFWSTFFIYGPLLIVESGLGKGLSGLVVSLSQALLLFAWVSGRVARRSGVRTVIAASFALAAVASFGAGLAGTHMPYVAIGLLLVGSMATSALDGVGGIPFLRSVRPHERQRMSAVYRTFLDLSDLIPSMIFAVALLWLPIGSVFVILSGGLAIVGVLSWIYLPRSL